MATYIPLHAIPLQLQDPVTSVNMSGGSLEFYLAGTDTATDLFSDSSGTSIGVSITLNSGGWPESGGNVIFLFRDQSKAIKIVGKNAVGATLFTADNIPAVASFDSTSSAKLATIEENADVTDATNVAAAGALMEDGSGEMSGNLAMGAGTFIVKSVTAGITASTTQTQGEGVLVSMINEVSTVANAGDTVTLPSAVAGYEIKVFNNGANAMNVFPASGDNIDATGVDTAVSQSVGDSIIYVAYDTTNWEST